MKLFYHALQEKLDDVGWSPKGDKWEKAVFWWMEEATRRIWELEEKLKEKDAKVLDT
jgi:hypothetical protein